MAMSLQVQALDSPSGAFFYFFKKYQFFKNFAQTVFIGGQVCKLLKCLFKAVL